MWEASTPPGTPSSPCALQPCTAEFSPTAASRAQSAEPRQTTGEVRAGGSNRALGGIHGGQESCFRGQLAELAAEGWVRWEPHGAVGAALLHHLSVPIQGSPETVRRPKGEWDTSVIRLG